MTLMTEVEINEWLRNKAHLFQWAFGKKDAGLNKGLRLGSCKRKTHKVEKEMLSCPSKTVRTPSFV